MVMQVFVQGGDGKTDCVCLCVCVFSRSEGANDWTLWRIQLLGGLPPLSPGNQRCVCLCTRACVCERVRLWCAHATLTFSELWITCPGLQKSPPAALFGLCAEYFLQHTEPQQLPNLIHTHTHTRRFKHGFASARGRTSHFMFVESVWWPSHPSRVVGELLAVWRRKWKVAFLGFAPTQEAF